MANKEDNRFRGMIGIAAKAGKVRSGEFSAEQSIKSGHAKVCLLASDTSDRTRKHFTDMCTYRNIPIYTADTDKLELGHMIGRGPRSMATIEDEGLARTIVGIIDGGNANGKRE